MNLNDIVKRKTPPAPWCSGEKIPWNDPGFSARMLNNHLSQEHDWASRRSAVIARQVDWINGQLAGKKARILDLGCGPGLYTHRLAKAGHDCVGVDFSPASIDYAKRRAAADGMAIEYALEDVRTYQPCGRFDLVMMLFSEFNVFTERDARHILAKASEVLSDGGMLLIEASTFGAVRSQGSLPATWEALESGLFSERPHLYLQEHFWDENSATATTRYTIIDALSAEVAEYGASMKAYTDEQYEKMITQAGLGKISILSGNAWPAGNEFAENFVTYACRARRLSD